MDRVGAQDAFCEDAFPRLVGVLTLYTADRGLAEDLAQEALARAVRHWRRVQNMDNPEGWLYRVAINLANSWFSRRRAERRALAEACDLWASGEQPPPFDDVLAVRTAMATLTPRQRAAIALRYYADLPVDEVASLLGCRPGTVRALTHQGMEKLRAQLRTSDAEDAVDAS